MPIKQLDLERKWYYRVLKVFLLLLPLILLLLWFLSKKTVVCSFIPESSRFARPARHRGCCVLYTPEDYQMGCLYIAYGGVEDDMTRRNEQPVVPRRAMKAAGGRTTHPNPSHFYHHCACAGRHHHTAEDSER